MTVNLCHTDAQIALSAFRPGERVIIDTLKERTGLPFYRLRPALQKLGDRGLIQRCNWCLMMLAE